MKGHLHIKFDEKYSEKLEEAIKAFTKTLNDAEYHNINQIKLYDNGLITVHVDIFPDKDE